MTRRWEDVRADKARRDEARGRVPVRSGDRPLVDHVHGDPDDPRLEVCYATGDVPDPCVHECTHSTHELLDAQLGVWEGPDPDRPRYRALAAPWYDHEPGTCVPEDPTHGGHLGFCHAGWELEVYRVDAASPDRFHPLGVTQTSSPAWNPSVLRTTVVDWLATRAAPLTIRSTTADVELYRKVHLP